MVSAACHIVINNPGIENVIILDRTPRFDLPSANPCQLKSKLSALSYRVLRDVLESCDVRAKTCVAAQNLPTELRQTTQIEEAMMASTFMVQMGETTI